MESRVKKKNKGRYTNQNKQYSDVENIGKKWYDVFLDEVEEFSQLPKDQVDILKSEAQKFLEQDTASYNGKISKSPMQSDHKWIRTVMNKGTVVDRIAAHTVTIQDSPVHTLPLLRNLVSMVKVSKKKECIMTLETLTELFLSDLLRPDQKLKEFEKAPLSLLDKYSSGNHLSRKSRLIHWYFEDQLKELYHTFIMALHAAAQDSVERNKEKAIAAMYKLLAGNPEQEALLLRNVVNKLGDPSQKIASKAIYSLIQLLQVHPNMKFVVMEETEKLLFRSNVSHKAQYYGICFLSQFLLSNEDNDLARNLIQIYFSFFKACVKKGEVDSRLMTALLTGVNRAYPYAKQEMKKMLEHIDTMYRVVHNASFNVGLHTLMLLFQVADFENSVSDRFYSALYKKLLDPQLATSSHQALFLSLVFKALKKDDDVNRGRVFFKRLLQICGYMPVSLVCSILYMVSQLTYKKKDLLALNMVSSTFMDDEEQDEEHYEDVKIEDSGLDTSQNSEEKETENADVVPSIPSWFHCGNVDTRDGRPKNSVYNPLQRNPTFAGGKYCAYTELLKLSQHFHPSVVLFASKILQGEVIKYPGDPLQDFALPRFLDRFVFKNPKKIIKEDIVNNSKFSRKKTYTPSGIRSLRVDSASYLNEDESRIPVDELFMYRYMHKIKNEGLTKKKIKKEEIDDGDESDVSSVNSEEFHEMLDSVMSGKEDNIDFAEELSKALPPKKDGSEDDDGGGGGSADEDSGEEDEGESGQDPDSGQENALSEDDDILSDDDLDDDAEDIVFNDSESDMESSGSVDSPTSKKKKKNKMDTQNKKKRKVDSNVFVSAEEFSEILDDAGAARLKMSGSSALSNRDNAGEKQLKWETARDFWVKRGGKQSKNNYNSKRKLNGHQTGKWNERGAKRRRK